MYLPDPRTEVVVKRKLTEKECKLFYPDNAEVIAYNAGLTEKAAEKAARKGQTNTTSEMINGGYLTANQESTLAIFEANANISRGVSYTKPRTITLDTKYDGVVTVNVWTGYAINVVSKTGSREVVVGPTTRLLDYDETLESMSLSTGKPKTTDRLLTTAYLRVENNKISDLINLQTSDFVDVQVKVSYCVDFLPEYKDKWFNVENYVKYMCDRERSLLKREAKNHTIEDFYANATDIVRKIVLNQEAVHAEGERAGRLFKENGMLVHDVEVLTVAIEQNVANILESHQEEMVTKALELSAATKKMEVVTKLAEYEQREAELKHDNEIYRLTLAKSTQLDKLAAEAEINEKKRAEAEAQKQAESDLQEILDKIEAAKLERAKKADEAKLETERKLTEIDKARQEAYAATVANIMESISPDLIAALTAKANASMLETTTQAMSPIAIANGESIADTTNKLLRGTSLEGVIDQLVKVRTKD